MSPLPGPDAAQCAHSAAVGTALRALLATRGGWLGFDEFLQQVLYAPGLGYYSAGATKFGPAGDFVTAPELSPLFGACLARHCAPLLANGADLLEVGAGSGALAETLLARLGELGALPAHYWILEVSADLRERQRARLNLLPAAYRSRVHWLERLPERPLRGVIVANEVADALPFKCFAVTAQGFVERGVTRDGAGTWQWSERPAGEDLRAELARLEAELAAGIAPGFTPGFTRGFAPGFRSELCTRLNAWIGSLGAALEAGAILLFDYGLARRELYHPQRLAGTLRCHYRQRAHDDPFMLLGLQDITAWVDFTRVAEAASAAGLEVAGYCTQAAFLLGSGIEAELAAVTAPLARARLASEARALLLPGEMGETFKAMALTRGASNATGGFAVQDLRRLL